MGDGDGDSMVLASSLLQLLHQGFSEEDAVLLAAIFVFDASVEGRFNNTDDDNAWTGEHARDDDDLADRSIDRSSHDVGRRKARFFQIWLLRESLQQFC